jgi:hypothetical protein
MSSPSPAAYAGAAPSSIAASIEAAVSPAPVFLIIPFTPFIIQNSFHDFSRPISIYGPGSAPTGAFCLHQLGQNTSIPDSENDFSRRLCSFFDEIVLLLWKNCEKSVLKSRQKKLQKKIFLQLIAHLGLLTLRRLYSAL